LLKKNSETIIPVSCTEAGRWSNSRSNFTDSELFAMPELRKKKTQSVHHSLKKDKSFSSDQREVWNHLDSLYSVAHIELPTSAMKGMYDEKKQDTESYIQAFSCGQRQKGILVIVNGEVVGFDYVSSSKVFARIFSKLIQSYAIEADLNKHQEAKEEQSLVHFINSLTEADVEVFKSPGHGYDCRLSGKEITGSALVYKNEVIHFSAFPFSSNNKYRKNFLL
jgi:hypothetical protein